MRAIDEIESSVAELACQRSKIGDRAPHRRQVEFQIGW